MASLAEALAAGAESTFDAGPDVGFIRSMAVLGVKPYASSLGVFDVVDEGALFNIACNCGKTDGHNDGSSRVCK